jgi:hypothetical protein
MSKHKYDMDYIGDKMARTTAGFNAALTNCLVRKGLLTEDDTREIALAARKMKPVLDGLDEVLDMMLDEKRKLDS